jgi:hypothetical protein
VLLNNANALLKSLTTLVMSNSNAVSRFGARTVVLTKFLDATLPHLTASQCADIVRSFRRGIEDAMWEADDRVLPAECHSTLLEQTNILLDALSRKSMARNEPCQ